MKTNRHGQTRKDTDRNRISASFRVRRWLLQIALLTFAFAATNAAEPLERTRLYTAPDAASTGGLKGRIAKPALPIEQILATPAADPEKVYQGEVSGTKRDEFAFKGLPVGKYDLVVIFANEFYEGCQLNRDKSTLTADDIAQINASIEKSEPYWPKKFVHRLEGETGRGNMARAVCTFFRDKGSDLLLTQFEGKSNRSDFRRTFKLVLLKNVGPGWQITRARDLYPIWSDPKRPLPQHHFNAQISSIRVADELKDLGDLDLSR